MLCAAVLGFESLVVALAIVPALALTDAHHGQIVVGGLLVVALCLLAAGLLRTPAGYALGSTVQILVVAGGFIVPAMFFLGGLFALLWVSAILVARRAARVVAARAGSNGHGSPAGQGDQPAPG